jgi:hypothetical protein
MTTMPTLYFKNLKTGKRYQILSLDNEKQMVTLKGETATFVEPYDRERFKSMGYVLEKEAE